VHEELVVCTIKAHLEHFTEPKGEFTILVPPAERVGSTGDAHPSAAQLVVELGCLTDHKSSTRRRALKVLAERHGMAVNDLYRLLSDGDENGQKT
jgi:hypothetical protein